MNKVQRILQFSDFLGFEPHLLIEGKDRFSTILSGLLSIVVILLTIMCTIYFGWDLVYKDEPMVLITNKVNKDFGPLNMSNVGFNFIFAMQNNLKNFYSDPSIFEVNATYIIKQKVTINGTLTEKFDYINVPVKLCSTYYTDQDILEKNIKFPLNLFYCLQPNAVELKGFWGTDYYSSVIINVNKCVNRTENNNRCKPQDVIDNKIQGSFISMDMTKFSVDQNTYNNPLQRIFDNSYNILNANSSIIFAHHIYPVAFQSDNGLMLKDNQYSYGWDIKKTTFNVISRSDNIVTFTFEGFASGPVYIRNYIKLQTVMTQVGGFIKAIYLIAKIICFFVTEINFYVHFMAKNEIVYETKKKNISLQQLANSSNPININNVGLMPNTTIILKGNERDELKVIPKNRVLVTSIKYIWSKICCCKKRKVLLSSISHFKLIFTNYLGVETIVKNAIELEETKKLLIRVHNKDYNNNLKRVFETKIEEMNSMTQIK